MGMPSESDAFDSFSADSSVTRLQIDPLLKTSCL